MSNLKSLTGSEFTGAKQTPGTVVLDFYADWCGPCKALAPALQRVADRNPSIVFGKVNIDTNPAAAEEFGIKSIPTLVFLRDGREVERLIGAVGERVIESTLAEVRA